MCPAACAVRRADATFLPQTGQGTQHGARCSTASGARWQGQSHASPGGGVGTNLVKARSRLGSPRIHQGTPRTDEPEDINVSDHRASKEHINSVIPSRVPASGGQMRNPRHPGRESSTRTARIPRCARNDRCGTGRFLLRRPPMNARRARLVVHAVLLLGAGRNALAQTPVIIRGGWIFTSTGVRSSRTCSSSGAIRSATSATPATFGR